MCAASIFHVVLTPAGFLHYKLVSPTPSVLLQAGVREGGSMGGREGGRKGRKGRRRVI